MRRPKPIAILVLFASVAMAMTACTDAQDADRDLGPEPAAMEHEARKELLPDGFPLELPVIGGEVVRSEQQGDDGRLWTYEIEVPASTEAVAAWYRSAYERANWVVHEDSVRTQETVLVFRKGRGAESAVRIRGDEGSATVVVSVGIGVPVTGGY